MKTKRKTGKLLSLVLAFVLALGALPVMPGGVTTKAAETISTVSATTIPLLANTRITMQGLYDSVGFDNTTMTLDQITIHDVAANSQLNSKTNAATTIKFLEGKSCQIWLTFKAAAGYSFNLTGATINNSPAVIKGSGVIMLEYTVPEATVLQNVDILVTDPKSGETPNYTARMKPIIGMSAAVAVTRKTWPRIPMMAAR